MFHTRNSPTGFGLLAFLSGIHFFSSLNAFAQQSAAFGSGSFVMPREQGLAGASAALATGIEAFSSNPAGIGGFSAPGSQPSLGTFLFPFIGATVNENSSKLYQEFKAQGGDQDVAVGEAVLEAHRGRHQYARVSLVPSVILGRTFWGLVSDQQVAAVPQGGSPGLVRARFRGDNGVLAGMSFPLGNHFFVGASAAYVYREQLEGTFLYSDMLTPGGRKSALTDATQRYAGLRTNVGFNFLPGGKLMPSVALVVQDYGDSRLRADTSGINDENEEQNTGVGIGLSPKMHSAIILNLALQVDRIEEGRLNFAAKSKAAMELQFGEATDKIKLALRYGYRKAGSSFGSDLRLGLLWFSYASEGQIIGTEEQFSSDRRNSVSFGVDLAH